MTTFHKWRTEHGKKDFATFYDSHYVPGITFPASPVSVGDRAFSWCDCFTEITIPASVTEIGESVFAGNKQLAIIDCKTSAQSEKTI